MAIDNETTEIPIGSEAYVASQLAERFTVEATGLTAEQLTQQLAQDIQAVHQDEVTVVSLIGGAASGKTTLSGMIAESLTSLGLIADRISTDDYVVGDRAYRREHFEGKEPRAKYDFELMNQKIKQIRQRQPVGVPTYNEQTGEAIGIGEENFSHNIDHVDVLIVEGDFPEVDTPDLRIFLHVSDEARLQARRDRDITTRSEVDDAKIVENFNLRQRTQHFPITLPAIDTADIAVEGRHDNGDRRFDVYRASDKTSQSAE